MLLSGTDLEHGSLTYDGSPLGNLDSVFTRDVATVDGQGILREIDERRFGTAVDHAPLLTWTATGTTLPDGTLRVLGTGWDHDGITPLMVVQNLTYSRFYIFRGENFDLVNTLPYHNGLAVGGPAGSFYSPVATIIHHGLIVFATEHREWNGSTHQVVGTSFAYTQDYGTSFQRVAQVGGGFDVPPLANGASAGLARGFPWSFLNPFPVNGLDDTSAVWFPWADYLYKSGNPKGGQIGLFQAYRTEATGLWTVLPNRLIFEQWIPEDTGGLHAHTAAVTTGGVISHWGDVNYRNETLFHQLDLANYQTAPITTKTVIGGYNSTPDISRIAPQPVAAAPAPTLGEHFASGDYTQEVVLQFGALNTLDDSLRVSSPANKPFRSNSGTLYSGSEILHLQWVSGVGYVSGARNSNHQFYHFSPDGLTWAPINTAFTPGGALWLYGSKLLAFGPGSSLWTSNLPAVTKTNPLQIAPGGTNRIGPELPLQTAPAAGNTRRQVEYVEGVWRYVDNGQALTDQPAPPPFVSTAPVYEVTLGANSRDLGIWWLQPESETLNASVPKLLDVWVYNLGDQSVSLGTRLRIPGMGLGNANEQTYESSLNSEWVPLGVRQNPNFNVDRRFAVNFQTGQSGTVNTDAHFLIATPYFGELNTPPYPLAPLASGSNELEVVSGFQLEHNWSVGFVFQWPNNAPQSMTGRMPVASLRAADGGYIEFAVEYTGISSARVVVESVRPGAAPVKLNLSHNILRGDVIEVAISGNAVELSATIRVGGKQPVAGQLNLNAGVQSPFEQFAWASGNGSVVSTVNPLQVMIDDEVAWTAAQQIGWMRATLEGRPTFRINPYPGDYNFDGVVDNDDAVVWAANFGSTSNLAADGDLSGVVDQADYELWEQYLGTRAPSPYNPLLGDFDFNGIVDQPDLVIWQNTLGSKKYLNADADRNGIVDQLDYDIWEANLGRIIEVPPQPLPGDYNFDGVVNAADYTVWRDTYPSPYKMFADGDQNGIIGDGDRLFWQSQFGKALPTEASGSGSTASIAAENDVEEIETAALETEAWSGFSSPSHSTKRTQPMRDSGPASHRTKMLLILDAAFAASEDCDAVGFARMHREKRDEISAESRTELSEDLLNPLPITSVGAL